ncbi:MAG: cytochrome c oxidase subunit 3 [Rhodospirillales bacterium]|nr:MAG: cytochrome c oxidase subunit 3 [Rhodospirillales bacterium]
MSGAAKHDFHMVEPSRWPMVGSIAAFSLTFGLVLYMHPEMLGGIGEALGILTIVPGLVLLAVTMFGWWTDVVREATFEGHHTPVVQLGHRYGMMLFIASEVMFFAAFFWAFFNSSLFPKVDPAVWPPEGIETFHWYTIPLVNTLILLSSGVTVTVAHHKLREGDQPGTVRWLLFTIILGILFTSLQAYEYVYAPFSFTDGIYPSTFFMATGFHGAHVIIGTTFLTVCLFRAMKGHFKPEHHFGFEAAAWYWHFVDVVWLFLFTCVYVWGS